MMGFEPSILYLGHIWHTFWAESDSQLLEEVVSWYTQYNDHLGRFFLYFPILTGFQKPIMEIVFAVSTKTEQNLMENVANPPVEA